MNHVVKLAVVGVGRIGAFHAQHAQELARELGNCELLAVVDPKTQRAEQVAQNLQQNQSQEIRAFSSLEALIESGLTQAAVVASPAEDHRAGAQALVDAGHRVLLEKPMTGSIETDREFTSYLNQHAKHAVMLAFQRRFDEALLYARKLLERELIGKPFKFVSVLEDSRPPPDGYKSPGLLPDMSVHNIDEVLWLSGQKPARVKAFGSRLYNYKISSVKEDLDDACLHMWFDGDLLAQIQVSRNHVPGYRVETYIFGPQGMIHVGAFQQKPFEVLLVAYDREKVIEQRKFRLRDYCREVPEFVERFGPAYKAELRHFVEQCQRGEPFCVDQNDGLRAMEVASAGTRSLYTRESGTPVEYHV